MGWHSRVGTGTGRWAMIENYQRRNGAERGTLETTARRKILHYEEHDANFSYAFLLALLFLNRTSKVR